QNLAGALAVERHAARQHLVEDDARRIDVDLFVIVPSGDFRRHVVDGADALGLGRALAAADELAQPVVTDLQRAVLDKNISRLEIAVDNAVVVQTRYRLGQGHEPLLDQLRRQPLRMSVEVYYALSDGGKEVALKLVRGHNLEVELRGMAQCLNLKHPNLMTLIDLRTDSQGDHWVVME